MPDFKKQHARARSIQNAHPKMAYKDAFSKAGKEMKSGRVGAKKKSHTKKKHMTRKKVTGTKSAHKPRTGRVGANISKTRSRLKKELESKLAWELLAKESARNVAERRKKQKAISETKRELKAIGGLKTKGRKRR